MVRNSFFEGQATFALNIFFRYTEITNQGHQSNSATAKGAYDALGYFLQLFANESFFTVPPEKILFCGLHTCPWYAENQKEIGQQARHNTIIVVYMDPIDKIYSLAHPHDKDEDHVTDKVRLF